MKKAAVIFFVAIVLAIAGPTPPSSAQVFEPPTGGYVGLTFKNTTPWCVWLTVAGGTQYTGAFRSWKDIKAQNVLPDGGSVSYDVNTINTAAIRIEVQLYQQGNCTGPFVGDRTIDETATQPTGDPMSGGYLHFIQTFIAHAQFDHAGPISSPTFNLYFGADTFVTAPAPAPTSHVVTQSGPTECPNNNAGLAWLLSSCQAAPGALLTVTDEGKGQRPAAITVAVANLSFKATTLPGTPTASVTPASPNWTFAMPNLCMKGPFAAAGYQLPVAVTMSVATTTHRAPTPTPPTPPPGFKAASPAPYSLAVVQTNSWSLGTVEEVCPSSLPTTPALRL